MPVVKISRAGVRFAPREVPTDLTVVLLPMTLDRVGRECAAHEQPMKVNSLEEAFEKFKPRLDFRITIGEEQREVVVELELTCMRDFDPKKIRSHEPGRRNDLADLQRRIDVVQHVRERLVSRSVKKAWEIPAERERTFNDLQDLERQLHEFGGGNEAAATGVIVAGTSAQFPGRGTTVGALVSESDSHAQALAKLDAAIATVERLRDEVLAAVFMQIRPLEKTYKQIQLFFENSEVSDRVERPPVGLFILNADSSALTNQDGGTTIVALERFVQRRNDSTNFRQTICNIVVPGYVPDVVRTRFEEIANKWGMLLIGDLRDERSFRALNDQLRTDGGAYEFLKRPEDKESCGVVIAGYLKLREKHWFEDSDADSEDADLYAPASMLFAGSLARADRTSGGGIAQRPVGMIFGRIRGVEKSRIEPRISQMEHLSISRQVVSIVRNEDNDLCFVGSRPHTDDPNAVLKLFTSFRVLRYLERRIATCLRHAAEQPLTRDMVKAQVREPIEELLRSEKQKGTIYDFAIDIDVAENKLAIGLLDMELEVQPLGPAESIKLKIDTPTFAKREGH
jgi:hypothetical protein